jgi:hypothetical protein
MNQVLRLVFDLKMSFLDALQTYWDGALAESDENPFPGAPPEKVKAGEVDKVGYDRENLRIRDFVHQHMEPEIVHLASILNPAEEQVVIEVGGVGWARDLLWTVTAAALKFFVGVTDASEVGCNSFYKLVDKHATAYPGISQSFRVRHAEFLASLVDRSIDLSRTIAFYFGQFIQNQDAEQFDTVLFWLGKFLKLPPISGVKRSIYLLHLRREDNDPDKVRLNNSTLYSDSDMREPLERGFGGPVVMEIIAKHNYWHHKYSLMKITGDV